MSYTQYLTRCPLFSPLRWIHNLMFAFSFESLLYIYINLFSNLLFIYMQLIVGVVVLHYNLFPSNYSSVVFALWSHHQLHGYRNRFSKFVYIFIGLFWFLWFLKRVKKKVALHGFWSFYSSEQSITVSKSTKVASYSSSSSLSSSRGLQLFRVSSHKIADFILIWSLLQLIETNHASGKCVRFQWTICIFSVSFYCNLVVCLSTFFFFFLLFIAIFAKWHDLMVSAPQNLSTNKIDACAWPTLNKLLWKTLNVTNDVHNEIEK